MTATHPEAALSAREVLSSVLDEYDRNICTHEETYRGGSIWTICHQCGSKWADDQGGFQPHVDPPAIARARKIVCDASAAHTATAGDGGERVRHVKRGTEYEVLGEAEAQVSEGMQRYLAEGAARIIYDGHLLTVYRCATTGKLWCRFTNEFRDGRFETIAQAPAVQAPAGWKLVPVEPTEEMLDAYWAQTGESNAMRERTHDFARTRYARMIAASPTPTDAQPKAARPLGDEALKPGLELALKLCERARDGGYLANARDCCREVQKALDAIHHAHPTTGQETVAQGALVAMPADHKRCFVYCGDGICTCQDHPLLPLEIEALGPNAGIVSSHTGQETVATPRDGGVREAIEAAYREGWRVNVIPAEGSPEAEHSDISHPAAYLDGCENVDWQSSKALAALSAPGSAGPGEPQIEAKERARKRIQALGAALSRRDWSAAESAYEAIRDAHDRPDIYDAPLRATPATTAETRGTEEIVAAFREAQEARDDAGYLGTVADCIRFFAASGPSAEDTGWDAAVALFRSTLPEWTSYRIEAETARAMTRFRVEIARMADNDDGDERVYGRGCTPLSAMQNALATTAETRGPSSREGGR